MLDDGYDDSSDIVVGMVVAMLLLGILGVIGPTRMAYDRAIPVVAATARELSAALNNSCHWVSDTCIPVSRP